MALRFPVESKHFVLAVLMDLLKRTMATHYRQHCGEWQVLADGDSEWKTPEMWRHSALDRSLVGDVADLASLAAVIELLVFGKLYACWQRSSATRAWATSPRSCRCGCRRTLLENNSGLSGEQWRGLSFFSFS